MQTEIEMDTYLFLKTLFILYLCYMFEVYPCCSLLYALADVHDIQHIYIFKLGYSIKIHISLCLLQNYITSFNKSDE